MFKLHTVQAQFGDSLILEFGDASKKQYILIDGGPPDNYEDDLNAALQSIVPTNKLELVVLSHIDNDHIVGLLDLLAALEEDAVNGDPPRITIPGLWHNSFQKSIDPDGEVTQRMQMLMTIAGANSVAMPLSADAFFGVKEGNRLRILAKKLKVPVNKGFQDDLVMLETAPASMKFGKFTLRVVGPNQQNLEALRQEWLMWLSKAEKEMASHPTTLANADKSVPNLSSIVLLAECDKKTVLLTGDARSDHILSGLDQAGLLSNGTLHIDVLKVAHHGSNRNHTATFFKKVTADTYVISANGKYDNPDYDTLKWIVEAAESQGRQIRIVVTNNTAATKKIKQTHKPSDFGYKLIVKPKADHSIAVDLS
jgi:beta-lactamase superfamily II metal-dependent hydrolase